jgi:hypothetical protein
MAQMKYVFYMKVHVFDNDIGFEANIPNHVETIMSWYLNRWRLYEEEIFVEALPSIVHEGDNVFKVSYYGLDKNLEHAVTNSHILADPDMNIDFPLMLDGEFCEVHGYPINIHTHQVQ